MAGCDSFRDSASRREVLGLGSAIVSRLLRLPYGGRDSIMDEAGERAFFWRPSSTMVRP